MILAEKIMNERKKLGWSQEELADKLDVSRQSVSKWESAQATPDLNRILKMAELFTVSTDYLLKDEIEEATTVEVVEDRPEVRDNVRPVSMEEATTYLKAVEKTTPAIASGVSMCICSPVVLLLMLAISEMGKISENAGLVIGIVVLLIMVAIGVFLFIFTDRDLAPFEYLNKVTIDTAYGVDGMVKEKKEKFTQKHTLMVAIGVILCILSVVPLLIVSLLLDETPYEYMIVMMVGVLLMMVSLGVHLMVRGGSIMDSYNKLLQIEDFTPEGKRMARKVNKVSKLYWAVVTAAYLAWSFITQQWHVTWIIWPVAGVLFGAIRAIIGMIYKED